MTNFPIQIIFQQIHFCFRMGIIGEPMTHYNPITLAPQGAENEEEEHEEDDKAAGSNRREYVSHEDQDRNIHFANFQDYLMVMIPGVWIQFYNAILLGT